MKDLIEIIETNREQTLIINICDRIFIRLNKEIEARFVN